MAVNPYINSYQQQSEQDLFESLAIENIAFNGQDVLYLPRTIVNKDELYGADDVSTYTKAYLIEMYIRSVEGFGGDGTMMTNVGWEIRNTVTFTVARRRFMEEIGYVENLFRPNEGDLVFFKLNNKCYEIKFVEDKSVFYPLGNLNVYDLECELFEYSSEIFNTGIPEVDSIMDFSMDVTDNGGDEEFDTSIPDPTTSGDTIQDEADAIIDFTEVDPFSDGAY